MISAIYGGDPMQLSLLATFPRFRRLEEEHGSLLRAMWAGMRQQNQARQQQQRASGARYGLFASLDGGLQLLTDALIRALPAPALRTGVAVERVQRTSAGRWRVGWGAGGEEVDGVVVALPAPHASSILQAQDPELSRRLSFIRYGSSATVSLAYREQDVAHPLDGFGFVVPAREGMSLLGCTFVHRKYAGRAPEGHVLLRAFHGDRSRPLGDAEVVEATCRDLEPLLGLRGQPLFSQVVRYPEAMPQYGLGHLELVAEIETRASAHPGLALAGNAYRGVGVPDCVRSGEAAAEAVLDAVA
jgi:oxygen-dependent protoporphyrinogen oxidase